MTLQTPFHDNMSLVAISSNPLQIRWRCSNRGIESRISNSFIQVQDTLAPYSLKLIQLDNPFVYLDPLNILFDYL